jgi:transposase-like protein
MGTIATELIEGKRDERGRQIRPANEREAAVRAYRESGLTQKAFAAREGVKYSTFVSWVQEQKRSKVRSEPQFAEVSVRKGDAMAALEIVLPDETVVRGTDLESVIVVAARLRRC